MIESAPELNADVLRAAKRHGFSDAQIAGLRHLSEDVVRGVRWALGVRPVYKTVDTCAAEFAAKTPYHYSSYDSETEVQPRTEPAVLILGSGPNRIGQGIEFDYSCVHAAMALSDAGYETVMVNCNPETVSTDYDTADRLYFEPLTCEDVLEVVHAERPGRPDRRRDRPTRRPDPAPAGPGPEGRRACRSSGTSPEAIHLAEERGAFGQVLAEANLPAPKHGLARSFDEAKIIADEIGYPVLVRPSYVLGGRGMEIVYDEKHPVLLHRAGHRGVAGAPGAGRPVPRRRGGDRRRRALRRHRPLPRWRDGAHRGGRHPLRRLGLRAAADHPRAPRWSTGSADSTEAIAAGVGVRGLINIQFALAGDTLYVLEANPRASRTVPVRLQGDRHPTGQGGGPGDARLDRSPSCGSRACCGRPGTARGENSSGPIAVKEAVMPFNRFRTVEGISVDTILGPEMKSTGEVMGLDIGVRHGVRQEPGRRVRAAADQGHRVHLGGQPGQAVRDLPGQAAGRSRISRSWPPPAPPRCCAGTAWS